MEDRISLCSQILLRYGRFQLKRSPAWISQKITTFPSDDMCSYLPRSPSPASREAALFVLLLWLLWFCFSIFSLFIFIFFSYIFFRRTYFCHQVLSAWVAFPDCDMTQVTQIRPASHWSDLIILASHWSRQTSGSIVNTGDYFLQQSKEQHYFINCILWEKPKYVFCKF